MQKSFITRAIELIRCLLLSAIQTVASHTRPLLTLVTWECPTFPLMATGLMALQEVLSPTYHADTLSYDTIRKHMLEMLYSPEYFFQPEVPTDVTFGDIGYVKNNVFVKLDNITDMYCGELIPQKDYLRSSGPIVSDDLGTGAIRFVNICKFLQTLLCNLNYFH